MKSKNPFPGMNPWLEDHWANVHLLPIALVNETLAARLPPDLVAEAEEHITIAGDVDEKDKHFRPDVAVKESWREGIPPQWKPEDDTELEKRAAVPLIVLAPPRTERWIEIHDFAGRLITVIEILTPGNKSGGGLSAYLKKQESYLGANLNLVEVDLLRCGRPTVAVPLEHVKPLKETHYWISVQRTTQPSCFEVYQPKLREPLPVIRIPLRRGERDVFVDLQPLIDRVYETGRYWRLDYTMQPQTPLPAEDMAWSLSLTQGR
ncbi:MAG: DUF4058 family protein [Roseimicrobium sp.]